VPVKQQRILILGGTAEAAALAAELVEQQHIVTTSLAGRTQEPRPVAGNVRVGGFGGVAGLVHWLQENRIARLIDATHPFARQISDHAATAARQAGIPLQTATRPPWNRCEGDNWHEVADLPQAANIIPPKATVLLALGSQHIALFAARRDVHFVVRMVDEPAHPLPFLKHTLILGKPPLHWEDEVKTMVDHHLTHIVCRNSGGLGAYAKIQAARHLKLPVIMITRPPQ